MLFVTTRRSAYRLLLCVGGVFVLALLAGAAKESDTDRIYRSGREALARQQTEQARELFEEVLRKDPDHKNARLNLGIAWSREQRPDKAEEVYRQLLRRHPGHPQGNNNLGNIFFRQGRYHEALPYYRTAVESKPDYMLAWFHIGWIHRQDNKLTEAAVAFERCLQIDPASASDASRQIDARYYLGTVRFRLRDFEGCRRMMLSVLEMRPNHLEANYQMSQALIRLGRREDAEPYLKLHRKMLEQRARRQPVASGIP